MKKTFAAAVAIAINSTAAFAAEVPDTGRAGDWAWSHNFALTHLSHDHVATISFSPAENCDEIIFAIINNPTHSKHTSGSREITGYSMTVDGEYYGYTDMQKIPHTHVPGVRLGTSVLNGIKSGSRAVLTTSIGQMPVSLSGSAKSLNPAHGNCVEMTKLPLMPRHQADPQSDGFFREMVRADGSKILAWNNVVMVFNDIQVGDDKLLKNLVSDMEEAGVPFKSVIFSQNGGGTLRTAMRMGDFIRSKLANTAVGGGYTMDDGEIPYCASACVYAFAGGVQRTIYLPSKVGMHQASLTDGSEGTMEDGQKIVAAKYEYLSRMGVDPAIVIEGSKTVSDEMWWLTGYEAKGYGLATRVTKPDEAPVLASLLGDSRRSGSPESVSRLVPSPADNGAAEVGSVYPARYSQISGPSFRCGGQLQPVESIICDDPDLARSDGIMGEIYKDLRSTLRKSDADSLRAEQRGWIKQRNRACPASVSDLRSAAQVVYTASCLRSATERRIAALWAILKPIGRK